MVIIISKYTKQFSFADIILLISVLLIGSFNEFVGCILSIVLTVYIFFRLKSSKKLTIKLNALSVSIALICLMYGITALWAIDSGMAFIGFLKFLPLTLYLITIWQDQKPSVEIWLPYFSATMVLVSTIGMHIPFTSQFFSVANRLSGFFQYPNTFALFLLVAELVLFGKERFKIQDFLCLALIVFGLLYSGSRTVFIIAIAANIAMLVHKFKKALFNKYVLIGIGGVAAMGIVVFLVNPDILSRYLSISLTESTFVGRILYWVDALPLLLKYPFGMGYLGFNYIQNSIQTGYYNVRYVHNDFLQLALDVGIIPTAIFIFAIIKSIFKKDSPFYKRVAVVSICAHSFFDFDLQFLSIFFLLILLLDHSSKKTIVIKKRRGVLNGALLVLLVINIYMGIHLSLAYFEQNTAADKLYPYNTDVKIALLENEDDLAKANEISDDILKQNTSTPIPYSVKAKYYYSIGDFNSLIETKRIVIQKNPFKYYEYEEYCYMLINGITLYQKSGDTQSVEYCQQELINVKNALATNLSTLSELGKKIDMQPQSSLPDDILYYISTIEKE